MVDMSILLCCNSCRQDSSAHAYQMFCTLLMIGFVSVLQICCFCPCSGQQQFVEKPKGPKLLDAVMAALRNDGSILMPVDTAGRVLEVMLLLEKHWAVNRLSYPLALLSPVAYNTLEFAKSQLEWMNEQVAREFENSRDKDNPFSMR